MNFNLVPSSSNELEAEASCKLPSTPPHSCYLPTAGTPSQYSSSTPSSPSLVSATGSAANDTDDDIFPLTPNSKSSLRDLNSPFNGVELRTPSSPQSKHCDPPRWTTRFEDQHIFNRLVGRPFEVDDSSGTINENARDTYLKILGELGTNSFLCAVQYLEAVRERCRMNYHAACWEVSEFERGKALARSMCEDSKRDFSKAEQEVQYLMEIFHQRLSLSRHGALGSFCPTEVRDSIRTSIRRTDAVLGILNDAKEMRSADSWYVLP
ncbi:uncharacterized protein HD556DRAFT_1442542 [Suillus plorans]|uniref:Uncharacterized protein n=1 Tax=Suillus plorans TaxID=116603 RepID=A0A9P7ARX1_9AGAM|nr:uncharacterized protein HD556DRAFT_1442542 [Suillus plorans]KAG1795209.1 hypothetical protein HD556DRAFT_1442542 [Suillus plorans]